MAKQKNKTAWYPYFFFGAAVSGIFLVLFITSIFGPGISGDSVDYLSTATNLMQGKGFIDFAGRPYIHWPPLYPILLAAGTFISGMDLLDVSRWLNAFLFGAVVLLAGYTTKRVFQNEPFFVIFGVAVTLFSPTLLRLAANVTSDPFFILIVLGFILAGTNYQRKPSHKNLIILAALSGLSALLRWNGVVLVVCAAILVLLAQWKKWVSLLSQWFMLAVLGVAPFLFWIIGRNYRLYGSLFGSRQLQNIDFGTNIIDLIEKTMRWFVPGFVLRRFPFEVIFIIFLGVIILTLLRIDRNKLYSQIIKTENLPWVIFSTIYLIFVMATTFTNDHRVFYDDRYYAPIFLYTFLAILLLIKAYLEDRKGEKGQEIKVEPRRKYILWGVMAVWLIFPILATAYYVVGSRLSGESSYNMYNTREFIETPFHNEVANYDFLSGVPIYSNNPSAAYILIDETVFHSPGTPDKEPAEPSDAALFANTWPPDGNAYLVWFEPNEWKWYLSPEILEEFTIVEEVFARRDGGLYKITRR